MWGGVGDCGLWAACWLCVCGWGPCVALRRPSHHQVATRVSYRFSRENSVFHFLEWSRSLRHGSPFLLHPFDWISSELGWEDAPRARMSFSVSPTHQAHASRGRAGATLNFWAPAEQSLIDDLAANADLRANAVQEELYPMYVMRVRELLQLDAWRPHQQLLSDGLLVRVTEEVAKSATIVFVSHQWTSFSHPDPTGAQLLALQGALSKLLSGELTVRADSILQLVYNYHRETGPAEWKQLLESGCVWLDFVSMPQPMAGDSTHQRASSDHRLAADGDPSSTVVSNLRNAVASIDPVVRGEMFNDVGVCAFGNPHRPRGQCL